jgi:hypothetical protein
MRYEVSIKARESFNVVDFTLLFDGILEEGQKFIVQNIKGKLIGYRENETTKNNKGKTNRRKAIRP